MIFINNWWKVAIVLGFIAGLDGQVTHHSDKNDLGVRRNAKKEYEAGLLTSEEAKDELFPWIVNINVIVNMPDHRERSLSYFYGSIIHPKAVITLASLTPEDPADVIVSTTEKFDKNYQERMVSKIYKHHNFKSKVFMATAYDVNAYDFAILILFSPFYFNGAVNSVLLPPGSSEIYGNCLSLRATIEGFDVIVMKREKYKLVNNEKCKEFGALDKINARYDSFSCSETERNQNSLCRFGNATPLICKTKNSSNYYLTGISIKKCIKRSNVNLNANVAHVTDWIKKVLKEQNRIE